MNWSTALRPWLSSIFYDMRSHWGRPRAFPEKTVDRLVEIEPRIMQYEQFEMHRKAIANNHRTRAWTNGFARLLQGTTQLCDLT